MTHKLHLIDLNKADVDATETTFAQEVNKKSSFILGQCPVKLCTQKQSDDGSASNDQAKKTLSTASTSISCSMSDSEATVIYLFGGFELIASIKSTEVYVTPSESTKQEENYITTCKGVPHRDNELENLGPWYKFIFVMPGGPKPVNNVRLKFVGPSRPSDDFGSCTITIRALKLKGRLPGDNTSQSQGRANQITTPYTSNNTGDGDSMAAMMAQMRNHHGHTQLQQSNQEEKDKSQAEIISSIAGLGLFLKSSEERTIKAMEKMVSGMESRIMERLNDLSARLAAIEQKYNDNEKDAQE
ncbi:hypothetical protein ACHAWT_007476 [Skeletonema menzelii]